MSLHKSRHTGLDAYTKGVVSEREKVYSRVLSSMSIQLNEASFLEVGAGHGFNVHFFLEKGILESNCRLIEPDEARFRELSSQFPSAQCDHSEFKASMLNSTYDVILISLVLSSVLDDKKLNEIVAGSFEKLNPGGVMIIYDFKFNNPKNKKVRGVSVMQLKKLLKGRAQIQSSAVSLAPPVGRRIGKAYSIFNAIMPFLRSHFILEITHDKS